MRNRRIIRPHALRGLGFHAHAIRGDPQQFGHMISNRGRVRANLWGRKNQGRVHIHQRIASRAHPLDRLRQKEGRVGALPARVGRRKEGTNIRCGNRAQQSVGDSVQEDVAVRVPAQSLRMRQGQAANLQRNAPLEFVRIPAVADASFWVQGFQSSRWCWLFVVGRSLIASWFARSLVLSVKIRGRFYRFRKNSANSISAGVVILIFRGEPITTATSCPERSTSEASSVPRNPSAVASSKAFFSTLCRKPCGVWAITTRSRGTVAVMTAPSAVRCTSLIVSMAGVPAIAAPYFRAASITS